MADKVLIVDDNPDILNLLRANLRVAGFETIEALNGEAALRMMDQEQPDVILLDLMMPVLDGWGVLEALQGRRDRPPVIVVTAAESASNVDRANRLGVTAYVTKPFNVSGLVDLVRSMAPASTRRADPDPAGSRRAGRS